MYDIHFKENGWQTICVKHCKSNHKSQTSPISVRLSPFFTSILYYSVLLIYLHHRWWSEDDLRFFFTIYYYIIKFQGGKLYRKPQWLTVVYRLVDCWPKETNIIIIASNAVIKIIMILIIIMEYHARWTYV